jgi:ferric-dicitrate binding protein FerR (iron transport regulator)
MTDQDLNGEWARSQIEAWVDGSLTEANRERMRAALERDPRLRAATERAAAVHRALREPPPAALPRGLRRKLLAIPTRPERMAWPRFALPVAIAVAALAVALWWHRPVEVPGELPVDERMAAIADFELAMSYLHKSARLTESEVTGAVGSGLQDAWTLSRESLERSTKENGG